MKNFVLTVLLAVLVVLTATSVRHVVAGPSVSAGTPVLLAIGTDPVPPVPPGKPPKPTVTFKTMAIGTDPVPPVPPGKPKPTGTKSENSLTLLAIGTDPVPPVPPKPKPQTPNR